MGDAWEKECFQPRKALDGWGNLQRVQIAKEANARKFKVWKADTGKKAQDVAVQLFAEEVTYVTHGPTQPSQQEPGVDGVIQERSVREPLV